jgi:FkbM family methyltransferase
MIGMEIPEEFASEYDLDALHLTTPRGRDFRMYVAPRYRGRYENQTYQPFTADLLSSVLRGAGLFVDIGAHYGFFSLLARSRNPELEVIAIEPTPATCAVLKRNVEEFGKSSIPVHQLAVSECEGQANFNISLASDNCSFYETYAATLRSIEIETTTVDALLEDREACPLVIKIDVVGHELAVLKGMSKILERFSDIKMIVKYNEETLRAAGLQPKSLLQYLDKLGFDIYSLDEYRRLFYRVKSDNEWSHQVHDDHTNLYCVRRDRALSVCLISHSSELAGAERILLELVDDLVSDYGAICMVVLPRAGPLATAVARIGAACIIAEYGWWCYVGPPERADAFWASQIWNSIKSFQRTAMPAIQSFDPDVVWTQTMVVPWGAMAAAQIEKPHVWYVTEFGKLDHGLTFFLPLQIIVDEIVESSDLVYTMSKAVAATLFPDALADRVRVLYFHIPPPLEATTHVQAGFFNIPGAIRIGIFSSVQQSKGQEDIVRAVARLSSMGQNVELLIAGIGPPDYKKYLVEIAQEHGIEHRVNFAGFLTNVYPAMSEIDIAVVCSRAEALGRVGVEAMLLGKPVVCTNTGGIVEYTIEGKTGFSYTPGDIDGLVERLEHLIADPSRWVEMGSYGRAHVLKVFSKDSFSGEVYRNLQKLHRTGRKAARMPTSIERFITEATKVDTFAASRKISRNDLCPCGSGKRYKHCHGRIT